MAIEPFTSNFPSILTFSVQFIFVTMKTEDIEKTTFKGPSPVLDVLWPETHTHTEY